MRWWQNDFFLKLILIGQKMEENAKKIANEQMNYLVDFQTLCIP